MATQRRYVQRQRAAAQADTRARILAATRELIPAAGSALPVAAIASHAGVAVQTIYDQFGSKGGLLIAVINDVQASAGLFDAFPWVFSSPDGAEALRRMIRATFELWDRAWPFLAFVLRAARVDPVVEREMAFVDRLRHAHFWAIARRIEEEHRLPGSRDAAWAADCAFSLTTPTVYEELVVRHDRSLEDAIDAVTAGVFGAILDPASQPQLDPAPDWRELEREAAARARAGGADPDRLSREWSGSQTSGLTSDTKRSTSRARPAASREGNISAR